jgi:hypothetical protein
VLWSALPDFLSHQVLIRELQPVDLAVFGPATSEEEGSLSSVRVDTSSLLYSTCCESPKLLLGVMRRIFLKTKPQHEAFDASRVMLVKWEPAVRHPRLDSQIVTPMVTRLL